MKQWFNNLKRHEQLMLLGLSIVLLLYVIFTLLWQPLSESKQKLQQHNQQVAASLQTVKSLAAEYKQLSGGKSGNQQQAAGSLASLVDKAVADNQLTMSRFQPSASGDAQVRFENASFNAVLGWLYQMEYDYRVLVKDLSISKANAPGLVNVSVRVSKG
jgi:general secretion pathway protein M